MSFLNLATFRPSSPAYLLQVGRGQCLLVGEHLVVHLPGLALLVGGQERLGGATRLGVEGQRLVHEHDGHVLAIGVGDLLQGRVHARAERALEVAELDDGHLGVLRALAGRVRRDGHLLARHPGARPPGERRRPSWGSRCRCRRAGRSGSCPAWPCRPPAWPSSGCAGSWDPSWRRWRRCPCRSRTRSCARSSPAWRWSSGRSVRPSQLSPATPVSSADFIQPDGNSLSRLVDLGGRAARRRRRGGRGCRRGGRLAVVAGAALTRAHLAADQEAGQQADGQRPGPDVRSVDFGRWVARHGGELYPPHTRAATGCARATQLLLATRRRPRPSASARFLDATPPRRWRRSCRRPMRPASPCDEARRARTPRSCGRCGRCPCMAHRQRWQTAYM